MGHTTRCMPLVGHLQLAGHTVILAGNDRQRQYWAQTCPDILTLPLQGYEVSYGRQGLRSAVVRQIPKIMKAIKSEHQWLFKTVDDHDIDGVISDNRYGLYHPHVPAVILTHQLRILSGFGNLADGLLQKLHYRMLNRFSACWVPDLPAENNLAGKLSHPGSLPENVKYAGLLSALKPPSSVSEKHLLILLSGPEPQRSILCDILWKEAINARQPVVFIAGDSNAVMPGILPTHIRWFASVNAGQLQPLLEAASLVVSRSGYSTLMDLVLLGKSAILIPTPGQTEQEYLAAYVSALGIFPSLAQDKFSLQAAFDLIQDYQFRSSDFELAHSHFKPLLEEWVRAL